MEERDRNFEGIWVPKHIYLSKDVCWTAKIIFMEIHSFTSNGKACFISNDRLAEFMGISTTQVSKHISKLIKIGWLEQVSFDGRKRYLRSLMTTDFKAALNFGSRQDETEVKGSNELNFNHTNTVTKPDTNTPLTPQGEQGALFGMEKSTDKNQAPHQELVAYINELTGRAIRGTSKGKSQFSARLKNKYTLEQMKQAVKNAAESEHHRKSGFKYLTDEFITREDKLQFWLNAAPSPKAQQENSVDKMRRLGFGFAK